MPTGWGLRRTQHFTELQAPGSQMIILGLLLCPSLFPTFGLNAFLPLNNTSSASLGISSSGTTADITEEVASVSGTQPGVTSAENPTSNLTGTTPGITKVASALGPQPAICSRPYQQFDWHYVWHNCKCIRHPISQVVTQITYQQFEETLPG